MDETFDPVGVAGSGGCSLHQRIAGKHRIGLAVPGIAIAIVDAEGLEFRGDESSIVIVEDREIAGPAGRKQSARTPELCLVAERDKDFERNAAGGTRRHRLNGTVYRKVPASDGEGEVDGSGRIDLVGIDCQAPAQRILDL
jgi:hypothetical protein